MGVKIDDPGPGESPEAIYFFQDVDSPEVCFLRLHVIGLSRQSGAISKGLGSCDSLGQEEPWTRSKPYRTELTHWTELTDQEEQW
jgi:hypothetical protein